VPNRSTRYHIRQWQGRMLQPYCQFVLFSICLTVVEQINDNAYDDNNDKATKVPESWRLVDRFERSGQSCSETCRQVNHRTLERFLIFTQTVEQ